MSDVETLHPESLDVPGAAGVRLRLWDYGGRGAPLLLCHCAGTLGRIWEPVIARLGVEARVLALDLRGHGDSDKPHGARHYQWDMFAADLLAVADGLGFGADAMAVGHSGGGVAVTLAQLARPGLFRRIALVDAILAPDWFFPQINPMAGMARRRKGHFASRGAVRERLGGKFPYNMWSAEAFDAYVTHGFADLPDGTVHLKCPGAIEAHFYEATPTENVLRQLSALRVPALFVTGADSYMLEHVQEQHRQTPGSQLEIFGETGHFVPQERPGEMAALLTQWFG